MQNSSSILPQSEYVATQNVTYFASETRRKPINIDVAEFLSLFRTGEIKKVCFRAIQAKGAPAFIRDDARFVNDIDANDIELLRDWNKRGGIYFVVNAGGDSDEHIREFVAAFAENDTLPITQQHANLDGAPLMPSIRVETGKSVHAYWLLKPGCSKEDWREIQLRLIGYFGSDPAIKNPSRVMRVPGFDYLKLVDGKLQRKPVECVEFEPERRYSAEEMLAAFPPAPEMKTQQKPNAAHCVAAYDAASGEPKRHRQNYYDATFAQVVQALSEAKAGSHRTQQAFNAGCRLGEFVPSGIFDEDSIEKALQEACEKNGLADKKGEDEVLKQIRNGIKRGANKGLRYEVAEDGECEALIGKRQQPRDGASNSERAATPLVEVVPTSKADAWESLFITDGEFLQRKIEHKPQAIYGLSVGSVGMIQSVTNIGKTSFLRNVAYSLACGNEFLTDRVKAGEPKRVLILDYETPEDLQQSAMRKAHSILTPFQSEKVRENITYYLAKREGVQFLNLSNSADFDSLRQAIKSLKPALVIIDTVSQAFSLKNENDNSEVKETVMKPLAALAVECQTAIIFSHHIGKRVQEEGAASDHVLRARGASAFASDSQLVMEIGTTTTNSIKQTWLRYPKTKGAQPDDLAIDLNLETMWFALPTDQPNYPQPKTVQQRLVEVVTRPMDTSEIALALPEIKNGTLRNALNEAANAGLLLKQKRGTYAPKGAADESEADNLPVLAVSEG